MSEQQFCKVFNFTSYQVLVVKEDDEDSETYKVNQITDIGGIRATMGLGFVEEVERDKCFTEYNKKNALEFLNVTNKMISENS